MKLSLLHLRTSALRATALAAVPVFALMGCATDAMDEEVSEIESALDTQNGGLTTDDEAPNFGDSALLDLPGELELVTDSMDEEAGVVDMYNAPDAELFHTTVLWGQFPADPDADTTRDWSGSISVNRGAIVLRARIGFEGETDRVNPRTDRRRVDFDSRTRPLRDGLRMTIIDATPESDEPLVLRYEGRDGTVFERPIRDLAREHDGADVDERGNRMVATAMRDPRDVCSFGKMRGVWKKLSRHHGRLLGRVSNARGQGIGHIRGIYGQRRNGSKVFFGKYINAEGQFKGIFAGHYDDGKFLGRWHNRAGDVGVLGGMYRAAERLDRPDGLFIGRWAETSCNLDIHRDAVAP